MSEYFVDVSWSFCLNIGQDTALGRQAKLFVCILSVENKIDTFQLATPPYQVLDELKVWILISSSMSSMLNAKLFYED